MHAASAVGDVGNLGGQLSERLEQALAEAVTAGGSLAKRLQLFAGHLARLAPDYAAYYDRLIARLGSAETGASAPQTGDQLPDMVLVDSTGRLRTLTDYLRSGPVVLSFKRGRWCQFCRIEVDALAGAYPQIKALGAEVIAIVPEAAPEFAATAAVAGAPFPVVTDVDCGHALALGLAMPVDQELGDMLRRDGIDLAALHAGAGHILPLPATFVAGPDRRIAARFVSPDFRARMETSEILTALRDLSRNSTLP